jgi:hypothetical protein
MPEPDPNDDILDNVVEVDVETPNGDEEMTDIPVSMHEQNLSRIAQAGVAGAEHNQQYNKILDLNYERNRDSVTLAQSLGIREVASQSGQLGIPLSGAAAAKG